MPLPLLLVAPFLKPFRASRLLWTYLLPLLPMVVAWDALASVRTAYATDEMLAMAHDASSDYGWTVGRTRTSARSRPVTYLVGVPR